MDPVIIKRTFPCSKRQLFDAWSQPALLAKWFFSSQQPRMQSTVTNSFTTGGAYDVIMHLQSGDYRMHGIYRAIRRYNHIAFTWSSHIIQDSLVSLDFRELSANRSELTLTHTQFPNEDIRGQHVQGWARCLDNLAIFFGEER